MNISNVEKVICDFMSQLKTGSKLCLLPVPRIEFEGIISLLDGFKLYEKGTINLSNLRIVNDPKNVLSHSLAELEVNKCSDSDIKPVPSSLVSIQSAATQIKKTDFNDHALIAFTSNIDMQKIYCGSHENYKQIISYLSYKAERALDTIRFDFCRMDLPATLLGRAGTIGIGSPYSTALIFDMENIESYIISGEIVTHLISCGLGLSVDSDPSIKSIRNGDVGNIIRRALAMFSETLECNSETDKFIHAMATLDFIAGGGFEYMKMVDVKKRIASHCASSKEEYDNICKHLYSITSEKPVAYRTKIIHEGARLEDLLEEEAKRKKLFRDLQFYISGSIKDMQKISDRTWKQIEDYRREQIQRLTREE